MSVSAQELQKTQNSLSIIENVNLQQVSATMQKIAQFQVVVQKTLKKDHDYGVIPGTGSKPTLLKPGAEKILMLMGLTSEYEIIEKVQDYERGFFAFTVKCALSHGETKVTEGVGHANTRERRYLSGKQQDPYTLANTVLKMAKKRAQVDAVLTVASLSEIFTQDLEDELEDILPAKETRPTSQGGRRESELSQNGPGINWSAFWGRIRGSVEKGGLGLTDRQVHELARKKYGKELASLTEVIKTQKDLDEFLSFIQAEAS